MSDAPAILEARGLMKRFGHVVALNGADFELYPDEIVAIIGDNGAGKSTLVKSLSGALNPDAGEIRLEGEPVHFRSPRDARGVGIETVYQDLAVAPALDIASNIFLGREAPTRPPRQPAADARQEGHAPRGRAPLRGAEDRRAVDDPACRRPLGRPAPGSRRRPGRNVGAPARDHGRADGGARGQGTRQVLDLIKRVRERRTARDPTSHDMPNVFELADRIHIMRLGRRVAIVTRRRTRCRRRSRS